MRYFFAVLFMATPLFAQQPPGTRPVTELGAIDRFAFRTQQLSLAVRRDAFIIARVVEGTGALNDFQKNNAIQKAIEYVDTATRKANEEPRASSSTMTALSQTRDALTHAREQGAIADLPSLQKSMLDKTHVVYVELFRELDAARRDRQSLVDMQNKLATVNQDLDSAMIEALGSTFDFIRAGGK